MTAHWQGLPVVINKKVQKKANIYWIAADGDWERRLWNIL
jgi:hypothetical protein